MALQISGGNQDVVMNALKAQHDGSVIRVFGLTGAEVKPVNAGAALTGTLLVTISLNGAGTGLSFESAVAGVISKNTSEVWIGEIIADSATFGDAAYYRLSSLADTGGLDNTENRIQGDIGEAIGELLIADTTLVTGEDQRIDYYSLGVPSE